MRGATGGRGSIGPLVDHDEGVFLHRAALESTRRSDAALRGNVGLERGSEQATFAGWKQETKDFADGA